MISLIHIIFIYFLPCVNHHLTSQPQLRSPHDMDPVDPLSLWRTVSENVVYPFLPNG